jgi:hypothetical protein
VQQACNTTCFHCLICMLPQHAELSPPGKPHALMAGALYCWVAACKQRHKLPLLVCLQVNTHDWCHTFSVICAAAVLVCLPASCAHTQHRMPATLQLVCCKACCPVALDCKHICCNAPWLSVLMLCCALCAVILSGSSSQSILLLDKVPDFLKVILPLKVEAGQLAQACHAMQCSAGQCSTRGWSTVHDSTLQS